MESKSDAVMRNMVVYRLPRSDATQDDSTEPPAVAPISAASSTTTEPKEESREELLLHSVIALSDEVRHGSVCCWSCRVCALW